MLRKKQARLCVGVTILSPRGRNAVDPSNAAFSILKAAARCQTVVVQEVEHTHVKSRQEQHPSIEGAGHWFAIGVKATQ